MMKTLRVILKSGVAVEGRYDEDEYESIYERWDAGDERMLFLNCEILTSEVAAIIWEFDV